MNFTKLEIKTNHPVKENCCCVNCLYLTGRISKDFYIGYKLANHINKIMENVKNNLPGEKLGDTEERDILLQEFTEDELLTFYTLNQTIY